MPYDPLTFSIFLFIVLQMILLSKLPLNKKYCWQINFATETLSLIEKHFFFFYIKER